jgi:hypothetical protein
MTRRHDAPDATPEECKTLTPEQEEQRQRLAQDARTWTHQHVLPVPVDDGFTQEQWDARADAEEESP